MMLMVHVWNAIEISVVQEILTTHLQSTVMVAQVTGQGVCHASSTQHSRLVKEGVFHVFHVDLMNVVVKGTLGVGVLGNIAIHAQMTGVDA